MAELTQEKIDLKKLPRIVGRMSYKQVESLFEDVGKKRSAHREAAVERGEYCPQCKWHVERICTPCEEHHAMMEAIRITQGIVDHNQYMYAINQIHKLRRDCPQCAWQEWNQFDECEYSSELSEAFWIYSKRMQYLESKEQKRRFQVAYGRPPADLLEFCEWTDNNPLNMSEL